jgi:hypothetical protein
MNKVNPKKLPDLDFIDGIRVIGICDWMDAAYGKEWPDYQESGKELMSWCAEHDAAYWAAPREDFFIHKAVAFARERGNKLVVVEDMS